MDETVLTHDVFLSYSSEDKPVVCTLADELKKEGLRVWFDEWEIGPGDSIPAKIEEGLQHSRVLLLCMSANAFGSDWAKLESYTFRFRDPLNKDHRFIPLRLDDAPIRGSLSQFRYLDWRNPQRQEYEKLLEAVRLNGTLGQSALKGNDRTSPNDPKDLKPGWTFQELPDHQIRAYHRQLCDRYRELGSFDLLEMCGTWRQLAAGFTREACSSGRHGAYVVHDQSVDSITRLLETACADRGLPRFDQLSRCLRRPDNNHLHYALALLDDLEARLRAEAIGKL
jgi:hypothetical protein